jgi:hypothetical protein
VADGTPPRKAFHSSEHQASHQQAADEQLATLAERARATFETDLQRADAAGTLGLTAFHGVNTTNGRE